MRESKTIIRKQKIKKETHQNPKQKRVSTEDISNHRKIERKE